MNSEEANSFDELQKSDEALILEVRAGSAAAYADLYERHVASARSTSYRHAGNASDAEDLVAGAFANVLQTIKAGKGPTVFFRAYLLTTIRRLAKAKRATDSKMLPTENLEEVEPAVQAADPAVATFEHETVTRSFNGLPERWQAVLWYTEIDGLPPAEVAPIMGMSPNAVSALALRAREGLKQSYLQNHLSTEPSPSCASYVDQLGAYARDGLTPRRAKKFQDHVDSCLRCTEMLMHLLDVGAGMRGIVFPAIMGFVFIGHGASAAITTSLGAKAAVAGFSGGEGFGLSGAGGGGAGSGGAVVASGAGATSLTTVLVASVAGLVLVGAVVASAVGLSNRGTQAAPTNSGVVASGSLPTAAAEPKSTGQALAKEPKLPRPVQAPRPVQVTTAPSERAAAERVFSPLSAQTAPPSVQSSEFTVLRPSPTSTPSPTPSPEPSPTPTSTLSPTPSPEPSPTPTSTLSPTPSPEPSPSPTSTPSPTPSPEPSPTRTVSPAPPERPSPTPSPTPTNEPMPSMPVSRIEFLAHSEVLPSMDKTSRLKVNLSTVGTVVVENPQVLFIPESWAGLLTLTVVPPSGWECSKPSFGDLRGTSCSTGSWSGDSVSFELALLTTWHDSSIGMRVTAPNAETFSESFWFRKQL